MSTSPESILKVLIVDDDAVDRMALRRALQKTDLDTAITESTDAQSALSAIAQAEHDCIFLDYNLPGENGLDLTRRIRDQGIRVPLIVLTGQGDEQTAVELMKAGASDYLPKHKLSAGAIARLVRSALRVYTAEMAAEKANRNLREKNALLERTNRQLAQQQQYIYRQNLKLQEVSRLKSEFLATMSHELRTPLNAIIGFSQIMLSRAKGPLTDNQQGMLERVLANGRNLLELINDVLSFSRLEAGRLELVPKSMNLAKLVDNTLQELTSLATQKSLQLTVDLALDDPMVVNDQVRLRQVLVNLLSNAIKFTEAGSVKVVVTDRRNVIEGLIKEGLISEGLIKEGLIKESSIDEGALSPLTHGDICITVTDTGCGISAEDQRYIFDPFHQADQKENRRHNGTGLGLAITHSLVHMMHGTIALKSKASQGTTFTIALPRVVVISEQTADKGEADLIISPMEIQAEVTPTPENLLG